MTVEYGLGVGEGETAGADGEEVDEIEMELPEGTDGPAGFRTRRKIKTRPNGCEGKFYSAATVKLCTAELLPISERLNGFRTGSRDDTFFRRRLRTTTRRRYSRVFFAKSGKHSRYYLSIYRPRDVTHLILFRC